MAVVKKCHMWGKRTRFCSVGAHSFPLSHALHKESVPVNLVLFMEAVKEDRKE